MNVLLISKQRLLFCTIAVFGVMTLSPVSQAFSPEHGLSLVSKSSSSQSKFIQIAEKADGETAQNLIEEMGQKAISFLSNEKLSESQKEKEFRTLLNKHFDMKTIGRFAMGRNWKSATDKQQAEYQKLFQRMIVEVYTARFNEYEGQAFDVDTVRDSGKKDALVTSYIVPDTGPKVQVDWRVRNKDGHYKIIDVIIEGVSMSLTQRSDFSSVIQRGGGEVEVLLEHLRK